MRPEAAKPVRHVIGAMAPSFGRLDLRIASSRNPGFSGSVEENAVSTRSGTQPIPRQGLRGDTSGGWNCSDHARDQASADKCCMRASMSLPRCRASAAPQTPLRKLAAGGSGACEVEERQLAQDQLPHIEAEEFPSGTLRCMKHSTTFMKKCEK